MANNASVYDKTQKRTALGIMHANTVMYPQATMEYLQKAHPSARIKRTELGPKRFPICPISDSTH